MKHYSTYQSQFIEMFGDVAETRSLCEICRPKQWPTIPTKDFTEDGYLVYGANGVIGHYSEYNHEHPTILMACRGASCGAINISQPNSYITGNAMCMDEVIPEISFEYLAYFLSNYDYKTIITGGAQPQITYANLKKVMVPIPSYNEQQSFALIYNQADKSKFSSLKSQFIEMFEEDRFSKYRLGNLVSIRTGKLDANASSENGEYPFFTCGVDTLKIDKYAFDCEAVLLAGNGDFCVKYYSGKFNAYQRTYVIETLDSTALSVPYLYAWLRQYANELREKAIGGIIKYIKMGDLTEALIPLPSLEEQNRYEAIAQQADKSKLIQNNTLLNNKLKFCYCYTPRHISS